MNSYRVFRVYGLLAAVVATACGSGESGSGTAAGDATSCENCSLSLVPTVRLASEFSEATARYPARVVRLADGDYAVGPTFDPGTVARFSSDGEFEASIGRYGEGPGEMEEIHEPLAWSGDSLAVLHDVNEVTVFSDDGTPARSIRIDSRSFLTRDVLPTSGGTFLARRTGTGGGDDFALREYSPSGDPLRSFGSEAPLGGGRIYAALVEDGNTIYALDTRRYEIDIFTTDAEPVTVARRLQWFPPDSPRNEWGGRPSVSDAALYGPGELAVLVQRPRAEFELPRTRSSSGPAEAAGRRMDHRERMERYEQFIEIIDAATGEAIASSPVEIGWVGGFVEGSQVFTYDLDLESGRSGVQLWDVTVAGRPQ